MSILGKSPILEKDNHGDWCVVETHIGPSPIHQYWLCGEKITLYSNGLVANYIQLVAQTDDPHKPETVKVTKLHKDKDNWYVTFEHDSEEYSEAVHSLFYHWVESFDILPTPLYVTLKVV